jgi:hypothetical protein
LFCDNLHIGFEVPAAVVMRSYVVFDITSHSPLNVNCCFRGALLDTYIMLVSCMVQSLNVKMDATCFLKLQLSSNGLLGIISQKIKFFTTYMTRKAGTKLEMLAVLITYMKFRKVLAVACKL